MEGAALPSAQPVLAPCSNNVALSTGGVDSRTITASRVAKLRMAHVVERSALLRRPLQRPPSRLPRKLLLLLRLQHRLSRFPLTEGAVLLSERPALALCSSNVALNMDGVDSRMITALQAVKLRTERVLSSFAYGHRGLCIER